MSLDNQCGFCGRFMKENWFLTNDEPDGWQNYWSCSLDEKHKREHPLAYG